MRPFRRSRRPAPDDAGSLPLAMLITMVGLSISGLLTSTFVAEVRDARRVADRGQTLGGAEAGLEAALGRVRAAGDVDGQGDLSKLPACGVLSGASSAVRETSYQVTVSYVDDEGEPAGCPPFTMSTMPYAVKLSAKGLGRGTQARMLEGVYRLRTPLVQVPMGRIEDFSSVDLCLDAGKDQPAANDPLLMMPCVNENKPHRQQFAYVKTSALVHPKPSGSAGTDMCVTATKPTDGSTTAPVTFQPCHDPVDGTAITSSAAQLWSMNKNIVAFEGTDDPANGTNGWCLAVQNPASVTGSAVVYQQCGSGKSDRFTMFPEPQVGAGRAGGPSNQLVNYELFGRCLDVTGTNPNAEYLIVWPCGTNPRLDLLHWNQSFSLPTVSDPQAGGVGRVIGTKDGIDYCLRSPLSTAPNRYVRMTPCSSANPLEVTWRRYAQHRNYVKAYTLMDSRNNCVQPDAALADLRIVVRPCDGNLLQKWNAVLGDKTRSQIQEK